MQNMCSYGHVQNLNNFHTSNYNANNNISYQNAECNTRKDNISINNVANNDIFSINGDRLEVFGISINIDDLIILIMLFFMFRENQIDYSIIIILALILFDQN